MKKYFPLLMIFTSIPFLTCGAADISDVAFNKHLERAYGNTSICHTYETKASVKNQEYEKIKKNDGIADAKQTYRTNMTNIYKCAIFETQKISFKSIKELINNDAELKRNILPKIEKKIGDIDTSEKKINCIPNDANTKNSVIKLKVLRETTYELCHYISYLEYLRDYNSDYANIGKQEAQNNTVLNDPKNAGTAGLANTLSTSSGSYNLTAIIELEKKKKSQIDDEINHSYKIFPIAFNVYNQYEDNMTIHILLELIKEDYIAYRNALHKTLNPINQVVYKIANAMKK